MFGLLVPTLLAGVAVLVRGGSLRGLFSTSTSTSTGSTGFRAWPAVVAAFGVELVLYDPPVDAQPWALAIGPWVWLATRLVLLVVLVVNGWAATSRVRWPWRLAALGVALNTLVIALNGGHMPQSPEAALAVWGASQIDPHRLQNVAAMGANTRLPWLGDIFAEPSWLPRRNVFSFGDILLALGVAAWVFSATTATPSKANGLQRVRELAVMPSAGALAKMEFRTGTRINGAARPHEDRAR